MEVLFKTDNCLFARIKISEKVEIRKYRYNVIPKNINIKDIKHLDDIEVLYNYRDIISGKIYPVYYEYNGKFITCINDYYDWLYYIEGMVKDYTLVNLKLLE